MRSKQYLTGHNTLTGGHSDLSTFQTEACGYLGILSALMTIFTVFPLPLFSSHNIRATHWQPGSSQTLSGHPFLHPAMPPARLGHHACSKQCQTLSPSYCHSATCWGSPGQHHSSSHLPPLVSPPQHSCRLWDPPGIHKLPSLPTNTPTALYSDYTGP